MGRPVGKFIAKYIDNVKVRKTIFTKRCNNLKKKTRELSILCDVDACLISFGRDGEFEVWPEEEPELRRVIQRYEATPKVEREENKADESSGRELVQVLEGKIQKVMERMEFLRTNAGGLQDQFCRQNLCLPAPDYGNSMFEKFTLDELSKFLLEEEEVEKQHQPIQIQPMNFGSVEAVPQLTFDNPQSLISGQSCDSELSMVCQPTYFQDTAQLPMRFGNMEAMPELTISNGESWNSYRSMVSQSEYFQVFGNSYMSSMVCESSYFQEMTQLLESPSSTSYDTEPTSALSESSCLQSS